MKKLIIACCAVLAIGCGMMAGGWAAGGQLYSSYYDSELHPFSESARDAADFIDRHLHYHSWWADGWHSGWLPDGIEEFVDDTVDGAVDDALDDIDTAWVDGWLEQRQEAINTLYTIPTVSIDQIETLELTLKSGTSNNFSIQSGADYGLNGDFSIVSSEVDNHTWELEVAANGDEVVLTLPESQPSFSSITIKSQLGACIDIDTELYASEIEISAENGTLDAELLSSPELSLSVCDGDLYAYIDYAPESYRIEAKTNYGPFFLNDIELVGPSTERTRYDNRKDIPHPLYELDVTVTGGGTAELYTLE